VACGYALLACACVLLGSAARAQTLRPDFSITNGQVTAQVLRGNTLYLGGSFSFVGPVTGAGVPVDLSTGVPAAGFPRVNGSVFTAVPDGAGGWFIGGQFTTVGVSSRLNLAHVLADQSVSSWNPGTNGNVRALLLRSGVLYVGGDFLTLGGLSRNRIGAVDATSGAVGAWNPNANSSVRAFAAGGSVLYVGGQFTTLGGQARNRIAALDYTTGSADPLWNPNANSLVLALWLDTGSGTLYVGGQFTSIDSQTRNRIAALEAPTGFATGWNPNSNNQVFSIVVSGSEAYVGGQFTSIGGQLRNRIAAVNTSTGLATGWDPNAGNIVQTMSLAGADLIVGGDFLTIGGQSRSRIAALSTLTGLATTWNPSAFSTVSVAAVAGSDVFVGGSFNGLGGVARNNLAAIDVTSGLVTSWDPNANNQVQAMLLTPNTLYVGGNFTQVGGQIRNNIAALDLTNGSATAWDPNSDGQVSAMALVGNRVYVGGLFNNIGGQARVNLAAVDATTGLVQSWNVSADNQVFCIDANASTVYVGGNFNLFGGLLRNFVGAADALTGAVTTWNPDATGTVRAVLSTCDRVYVGGFFTSIGGQARNRLATTNLTTGQALAWNPNANGPVFALLPAPGTVYVGGVLSSVGGVTRNRIAAVDPTSAAISAWNPNSNGTVRSVAADAAGVYIGGVFSSIAGLPSGNLAVVTPDAGATCPVITLTPPPLAAGVVGASYSASIVASGGSGPYCFAVTAGVLPGGLSLDGGTGQISGTPTVAVIEGFSVTATDTRGCSGVAGYTITVIAAPAVNSVSPVTTGLCLNPAQPCVSIPFVLTRGDAIGLRGVSVTFQLDSSKLRLCTPGSPAANAHLSTWANTFTNRSLQVTDLGAGRYTVDAVLLGSPCGSTGDGSLFTFDVAAQGPVGVGAVSIVSVVARDCSNIPVGVTFGPAGSIGISSTSITLAPSTLPNAATGAAYSQLLTASGGTAPFTFALDSGTLPPGITLSPTGLLSGAATTGGSFAFTVRVTETNGCSNAQAFTLSAICPTILVSPAFLPDGAVGTPYSSPITALAGVAPLSFTVSFGALPAGLLLSSGGLLSGTPSSAGPATFTVAVTDAAGCSGSRSYSVDVFSVAPVSSVAAQTSGLAISAAHPCVSVPFVYTRGEAAAARGLTVSFQIDPAKLALCGTPAASVHLGSWFAGFGNTSLQITNDGGGAYTVDATLLGLPCGITTDGTLFTLDLQAADGDGSGGLTVTRVKSRDCANAAIGVLAGAPASLRIQNTLLALTPANLPNGTVGSAYEQIIAAPSGIAPFTFWVALGALPPGLALASDGTLAGTPTATGSYAFTVGAADGDDVPGSRAYTMSVACPVIDITPSSLPDAQLGTPYAATLVAAGGTAPYAFAVSGGALPTGLSLAATGELTGVPTATGVAVVTVAAVDTFGCVGTVVFTLPVFVDPAISRILPVTNGLCLSANRTCVSVPFEYQRGDNAPVRGASVTFQLDPRFTLCTPGSPAASIRAGGWLAAYSNKLFQVISNGGGSYTVDQTLLGLPCGPTTGGTLFTVDLATIGGDGAGDLTVTTCQVRDCASQPLPAQPGPPAQLVVSHTAPPAIGDLVATQVPTGNGPGERTGITLAWTLPLPGSVALYRAPFGSYPEYDDGGGTLPDSAAAPAAPWTLVNATAISGMVDLPTVRGSWHYVAFLTDSCGNRSAVSNMTRGALDYHLGDVSDGFVRGAGDNRVGLEDVSLLGAHYGISGAMLVTDSVAYLDVGPTLDGLINGRPATDNLIDFEDLMVFSLNFQSVSAPQSSVRPAQPPTANRKGESFELEAPALVRPDDEVAAVLHLTAGGSMQGFSAQLAWDPTVVQPIGSGSGGFLEAQGGAVLSPRAGAVDGALLGVRGMGITGSGDLATFRFRALREGDAAIRIASVNARDANNRPLDASGLGRSVVAAVPAHTLMLAPSPNPARGAATLAFALAQSGHADLAIYSVDGRRVRTLAHGARAAGTYRLVWMGEDDGGRAQAPGMYWARLVTGGSTFTRRVVYLR
jgi:hypothetical protein